MRHDKQMIAPVTPGTSINSTMETVFSGSPPTVSFEFFPPRTDAMEATLWESVTALEPLRPAFVSVTYGAGGSTRERTHHTVTRMARETGLNPAAHLTCVGSSRAEISAIAEQYWQAGIRHIVALRGDLPEGMAGYVPHPQGYSHASDLVSGLKMVGDFEISVAAFPEGHPETPGIDADIDNLQRKIDAGATRAITQYFFDVEHYLRYLERAHKRGIAIPIVPGLLPVTNFKQVRKFSTMCGASVPDWLAGLFTGLDNDPTTRMHVAAAVVAEQCRQLRKAGVNEFHFYTLNRAELTLAICHMLGIRQR